MYGQARTAKKPGPPNIVGVDRNPIGNRCRVVVMPKRSAQGSRRVVLSHFTQRWRSFRVTEMRTLDYALWRNSHECLAGYSASTNRLDACRWIRGGEESQKGKRSGGK
jgi:hypothetical protein